MPAKNRGRRYFFTDQKIQEYNRTIIRLRNLECDAFLELRKIARLNLVSKRCQDAGVFFAAVAAEMASPYEREEDHPGVEAPPLDPAHYSELEELLAFVNHSSERLWLLRTGRKTLLAALSRGLKRLRNVLVKLLRHFREMAPALPARFESHEYDGGDCSRCHGPLITPAGERPARERNEIQ